MNGQLRDAGKIYTIRKQKGLLNSTSEDLDLKVNPCQIVFLVRNAPVISVKHLCSTEVIPHKYQNTASAGLSTVARLLQQKLKSSPNIDQQKAY